MERCFYHFWTQKGPPLEENIGAMKVPPNSYLYISDPMSNWVNRANNFSQLILFSAFLHQSLIPLQTIRKIIRLNTSSEHLKNQEWKLC